MSSDKTRTLKCEAFTAPRMIAPYANTFGSYGPKECPSSTLGGVSI